MYGHFIQGFLCNEASELFSGNCHQKGDQCYIATAFLMVVGTEHVLKLLKMA